MLRHVFLLPYDGDPTEGYTVPTSGFDKSELVQPDSGALYPAPPADSVLVGLGSDEHDRKALWMATLTDPFYADWITANQAEQSIIEAEMLTWASELVAQGFEEVGVYDL